jgi:hypothetical protein
MKQTLTPVVRNADDADFRITPNLQIATHGFRTIPIEE